MSALKDSDWWVSTGLIHQELFECWGWRNVCLSFYKKKKETYAKETEKKTNN